MKIIRQIIRGCGTLPHVGDHPGTVFMLAFLMIGALAGAERGGLRGSIGGALAMAVFILPLYLKGAYDSAQDSDRIRGRK